RGQGQEAGVGEQDVEASLLPLYGAEQPVEVREVRDVTRHAGDVLADLPDRLIEFRLAASRDEDMGAFGDESPGGGQADAAVAPGDDRDPTFQFLRHATPPLPVRAVRVKACEYVSRSAAEQQRGRELADHDAGCVGVRRGHARTVRA